MRRILCIARDDHVRTVFSNEALQKLTGIFEVTFNKKGRDYTSEEVADEIVDFDGLITGWGSPPLTNKFFEKANRLRIIAHSAGSIKPILSKNLIEKYVIPRRICVCNASKAIAYNVAESTIGYFIMASHRFIDHIKYIRETPGWRDPAIPPDVRTLNGSVIGLVSAGQVGQEVIRLLKSFDTKILVYDPYLTNKEARRLGVSKVSLKRLFISSDFVTIHAPLTKETEGLIDARCLKLLHDGAIIVNTSRGRVIDQDALLRECMSGRITAVLDVTDPEPLPPESPLRRLSNVMITPHVSGSGIYGYKKIGDMTVRSLEQFFKGKRVEGQVDLNKYDIIA